MAKSAVAKPLKAKKAKAKTLNLFNAISSAAQSVNVAPSSSSTSGPSIPHFDPLTIMRYPTEKILQCIAFIFSVLPVNFQATLAHHLDTFDVLRPYNVDAKMFYEGRAIYPSRTNIINLVLGYVFGKVTEPSAQFLADDNIATFNPTDSFVVDVQDIVTVGLVPHQFMVVDMNGRTRPHCMCNQPMNATKEKKNAKWTTPAKLVCASGECRLVVVKKACALLKTHLDLFSGGRLPLIWCPNHPEANTVIDVDENVLTIRCTGRTGTAWCDSKSRVEGEYCGPLSSRTLQILKAIQFKEFPNVLPENEEDEDEQEEEEEEEDDTEDME